MHSTCQYSTSRSSGKCTYDRVAAAILGFSSITAGPIGFSSVRPSSSFTLPGWLRSFVPSFPCNQLDDLSVLVRTAKYKASSERLRPQTALMWSLSIDLIIRPTLLLLVVQKERREGRRTNEWSRSLWLYGLRSAVSTSQQALYTYQVVQLQTYC